MQIQLYKALIFVADSHLYILKSAVLILKLFENKYLTTFERINKFTNYWHDVEIIFVQKNTLIKRNFELTYSMKWTTKKNLYILYI